jgi:hypothetical protein
MLVHCSLQREYQRTDKVCWSLLILFFFPIMPIIYGFSQQNAWIRVLSCLSLLAAIMIGWLMFLLVAGG